MPNSSSSSSNSSHLVSPPLRVILPWDTCNFNSRRHPHNSSSKYSSSKYSRRHIHNSSSNSSSNSSRRKSNRSKSIPVVGKIVKWLLWTATPILTSCTRS